MPESPVCVPDWRSCLTSLSNDLLFLGLGWKSLTGGGIGRMGIVLTSGSTDPNAIAESEFRSKWANAEHRAFLAFTSADLEPANKIERVLKSKNFAVFTYLKEKGGSPNYSADFTRQMFDQAEIHLGLDTHAARHSRGMWAEQKALAELESHKAAEKAAREAREAAEKAAREARERAATYEADRLGRDARGVFERSPVEGSKGGER